MDYGQLKRALGEGAADDLENAVLHAMAEARSPESMAALCRLLAVLMAAVAHRADGHPDLAQQCMSDFSAAFDILCAA